MKFNSGTPDPRADLLTLTECRITLRVDIKTVYNWRKLGILRDVLVGRSIFISRSNIDDILNGRNG